MSDPPASASSVRMREQAWHALSELFRDTQLIEADFVHIAARLAAAGFGAASAQRILVAEVAPVFYTNLRQVQGTRSPWTLAEVRWQVSEFLHRFIVDRWVRTQYARLFSGQYRANWRHVAALLAAER